jgi:hypothetical protein
MKSAGLVLAGLWLGALLASWVAATVNFRTADRVLAPARPEMEERLASVPPEARRQVMRHLASEINRWMFRNWALAQLVLGLALLVACWRMGGWPRALAGVALALAAAQMTTVAPIVDLGRSIDFLPRPLPPEVARRFGLLHAAYVVSDLVKAALLAALAVLLAGRR